MEENKKTKEYSDIYKRDNTLARIIDVVSWIILAIGVVLGIIMGSEYDNFGVTIIVWVSDGLFALSLFALAEIITILQDIRRKLFEKK